MRHLFAIQVLGSTVRASSLITPQRAFLVHPHQGSSAGLPETASFKRDIGEGLRNLELELEQDFSHALDLLAEELSTEMSPVDFENLYDFGEERERTDSGSEDGGSDDDIDAGRNPRIHEPARASPKEETNELPQDEDPPTSGHGPGGAGGKRGGGGDLEDLGKGHVPHAPAPALLPRREPLPEPRCRRRKKEGPGSKARATLPGSRVLGRASAEAKGPGLEHTPEREPEPLPSRGSHVSAQNASSGDTGGDTSRVTSQLPKRRRRRRQRRRGRHRPHRRPSHTRSSTRTATGPGKGGGQSKGGGLGQAREARGRAGLSAAEAFETASLASSLTALSAAGWTVAGLSQLGSLVSVPAKDMALLMALGPCLVFWSYNRDQARVHSAWRNRQGWGPGKRGAAAGPIRIAPELGTLSKTSLAGSLLVGSLLGWRHPQILLPFLGCLPLSVAYAKPVFKYRGRKVPWKSMPGAKLLIGALWGMMAVVVPQLVASKYTPVAAAVAGVAAGAERRFELNALWRTLCLALGVMLCVDGEHTLQDVRVLAREREEGVLSLPVLLGPAGARMMAMLMSVLAGLLFLAAGCHRVFAGGVAGYTAALALAQTAPGRGDGPAWVAAAELQGVAAGALALVLVP